MFWFKKKRHVRTEENLRCSFCGKTGDMVEKLISNPAVESVRAYICNECVTVCNSILEEDKKAKKSQ